MVAITGEGDWPDRRQVEKPAPNSLEGTPEGQQVRNATGGHVEVIKAANPNASDGSVKNWAQMTGVERYAHAEQNGQEESFALVDRKPSGIEVVAARQMVSGVKLESQEQPIGQNLIVQNLIVQNLAEVDNRPIKNYDYLVKQHGDQVIETGLQYQMGKPPEVAERSLFERIGALPLEQQAFVVGAGIKAFNGELSHQQFRIGVGLITGLGDGVVGLAEGAESLGTAIIGVAQFSRDVMANDLAAVVTAGKAGESLGKLMVGGIHVFSAADDYLGSVEAATNDGDYTKALRDVSWLGQQKNSRWEAMSPEEKTRLTTKLAIENLGDLALIAFRPAKIAKSEKIIETLEAMGTEASELGAGQRDKAGKFISRLLDELMPQPMGVTPDGHFVSIPRDSGKLENVLKMVGRTGEYVSEHKPMFLAPGPNKVLSERKIGAFGGLKKLEAMSDGELASIGLRRYEMPKLRLENDQFSIQAKIPGDSAAWFRAIITKEGDLMLTDLNKGGMPDGVGGHFLAEALKGHRVVPMKKVILKKVINEETLSALEAGIPEEDTKIGRCVAKGLKELGVKPGRFEIEKTYRGINIVIDLH